MVGTLTSRLCQQVGNSYERFNVFFGRRGVHDNKLSFWSLYSKVTPETGIAGSGVAMRDGEQ